MVVTSSWLTLPWSIISWVLRMPVSSAAKKSGLELRARVEKALFVFMMRPRKMLNLHSKLRAWCINRNVDLFISCTSVNV